MISTTFPDQVRDAVQKKHVLYSDIVTIAFDPLPP